MVRATRGLRVRSAEAESPRLLGARTPIPLPLPLAPRPSPLAPHPSSLAPSSRASFSIRRQCVPSQYTCAQSGQR